MTKKICKLFGLKVFEVENYGDEEPKPVAQKGEPEGVVLDMTPEELKKMSSGTK